jgi:hypothetical protein
MMMLLDIKLGPGDMAMKGWLSNWTYLSMKLQENPDLCSEDYLKLMKLELDGRCRKDIVHRLKNKFNTTRRNEEWQELVQTFNL